MAGIQDKVVAITGASSRIGEAAAVMLAERGAKTCRVSSTWRMTVTASSRLLFVIAAAGKKN